MNAVAQKASVKAQELREKLWIRVVTWVKYVKPPTIRKSMCVDGEMFRLNESTGKYQKYDFMENTPWITLKK